MPYSKQNHDKWARFSLFVPGSPPSFRLFAQKLSAALVWGPVPRSSVMRPSPGEARLCWPFDARTPGEWRRGKLSLGQSPHRQPHLEAILSCLFTRRGRGDRSPQLFLVAGKNDGLPLPPEPLSEHPETGPPVPHWGALAQGSLCTSPPGGRRQVGALFGRPVRRTRGWSQKACLLLVLWPRSVTGPP